jgi:hypothetical protein
MIINQKKIDINFFQLIHQYSKMFYSQILMKWRILFDGKKAAKNLICIGWEWNDMWSWRQYVKKFMEFNKKNWKICDSLSNLMSWNNVRGTITQPPGKSARIVLSWSVGNSHKKPCNFGVESYQISQYNVQKISLILLFFLRSRETCTWH